MKFQLETNCHQLKMTAQLQNLIVDLIERG